MTLQDNSNVVICEKADAVGGWFMHVNDVIPRGAIALAQKMLLNYIIAYIFHGDI